MFPSINEGTKTKKPQQTERRLHPAVRWHINTLGYRTDLDMCAFDDVHERRAICNPTFTCRDTCITRRFVELISEINTDLEPPIVAEVSLEVTFVGIFSQRYTEDEFVIGLA